LRGKGILTINWRASKCGNMNCTQIIMTTLNISGTPRLNGSANRVKRPYGMIGLFLTPLMRRWNFSMIGAESSWVIMLEQRMNHFFRN